MAIRNPWLPATGGAALLAAPSLAALAGGALLTFGNRISCANRTHRHVR